MILLARLGMRAVQLNEWVYGDEVRRYARGTKDGIPGGNGGRESDVIPGNVFGTETEDTHAGAGMALE